MCFFKIAIKFNPDTRWQSLFVSTSGGCCINPQQGGATVFLATASQLKQSHQHERRHNSCALYSNPYKVSLKVLFPDHLCWGFYKVLYLYSLCLIRVVLVS